MKKIVLVLTGKAKDVFDALAVLAMTDGEKTLKQIIADSRKN